MGANEIPTVPPLAIVPNYSEELCRNQESVIPYEHQTGDGSQLAPHETIPSEKGILGSNATISVTIDTHKGLDDTGAPKEHLPCALMQSQPMTDTQTDTQILAQQERSNSKL
jgi:hypothetical protein